MQNKLLLGGTFVVFVAVLGTAYFTLPNKNNPAITISDTSTTVTPDIVGTTPSSEVNAKSDDTSTTKSTDTTTTVPAPAANKYTLAAVATHKDASSCWVAINGNVYNLTAWINQHPGGPDKILGICGTDASAAFNAQHSGQSQPMQELKNFLLGPLSS